MGRLAERARAARDRRDVRPVGAEAVGLDEHGRMGQVGEGGGSERPAVGAWLADRDASPGGIGRGRHRSAVTATATARRGENSPPSRPNSTIPLGPVAAASDEHTPPSVARAVRMRAARGPTAVHADGCAVPRRPTRARVPARSRRRRGAVGVRVEPLPCGRVSPRLDRVVDVPLRPSRAVGASTVTIPTIALDFAAPTSVSFEPSVPGQSSARDRAVGPRRAAGTDHGRALRHGPWCRGRRRGSVRPCARSPGSSGLAGRRGTAPHPFARCSAGVDGRVSGPGTGGGSDAVKRCPPPPFQRYSRSPSPQP